MMKMNISKPLAKFFKYQICGESAGHMAMIPNNPVLHGLMMAHSKYETRMSDEEFCEFLRGVVSALEE